MLKTVKIFFFITIMLVAQIGSTGVIYFENTCLTLNTTKISLEASSCGCQKEFKCSEKDEPVAHHLCCYHTPHFLQITNQSKLLTKSIKETPRKKVQDLLYYYFIAKNTLEEKKRISTQIPPLPSRNITPKRIIIQSFQI